MVNFAKDDPKKEFSMNVMGSHYARSASFSKEYNPYLYYFPFPQIVSVAAFSFYPQFFSNGTYGAGGVPNYKSIMSIIGAEYDQKTGEFKYVPERWPENCKSITPFLSAAMEHSQSSPMSLFKTSLVFVAFISKTLLIHLFRVPSRRPLRRRPGSH
jgi:hypothetical protein